MSSNEAFGPSRNGRVIKFPAGEVDGRAAFEEYRVSPLTIEDFGAAQEWIDRQFPDPYDAATRAIARGRLVFEDDKLVRQPYTHAQQQHMLRCATELAASSRRLIGLPEADAVLSSIPGLIYLMAVSIRKNHPEFTEEDARRLTRHMTLIEVSQLYAETQVDIVAGVDPMAALVPKSEPGATTATPNDGTTTPLPD